MRAQGVNDMAVSVIEDGKAVHVAAHGRRVAAYH